MSALRDKLLSARNAIRIPTAESSVHKGECVYSFDSPFATHGLFVNVQTWQAVGMDFLQLDSGKTGVRLYLQLIYRYVEKPREEGDSQSQPVITKLAIGLPGGFQTPDSNYDLQKTYFVVYVNTDGSLDRLPFPSDDIPEIVSACCQAIIDHQDAGVTEQVRQWEDENQRPVSKYAETLIQVDNGKRISNDPSTWACEDSGMTENLWMNLSTGYIGSGRPNWDGTGGTGAALRHYEQTGGMFPLVVKLGTITPHGADVWSYAPDEDCLVTDPKLAEHLSHWGIDIMKLQKTDATLAEMEVALNQQYAWSKITEAGKSLVKLYGSSYVGLKNLGNSCYMNSVLQLLFHLPEFRDRFLASADGVFHSAPAGNVSEDLFAQLCKLAVALHTDRYVIPETARDQPDILLAKYTVSPRMLRTLVGRGHPEFSTGRQQDTLEYLQHFLEYTTRAERTALARLQGSASSAAFFDFEFEDRVQCTESRTVRYISRSDNVLSLVLPEVVEQVQTSAPENTAQSGEPAAESQSKRPRVEEDEVTTEVPFDVILNNFAAQEMVENFRSPALQGRSVLASKIVRFKNFPRYLVVHLRRYYVDSTWNVKKNRALVPMPETLDLEHLRSHGQQPDEVLMPSEQEARAQASAPRADDMVVMQLSSMGFSENACKRAAIATNNDIEAATNWLLTHMDDSDFNDPPVTAAPQRQQSRVEVEADPEMVAMLSSMGFSEKHVKFALKATDFNPERAVDWLFSHSDDLDAAISAANPSAAPSTASASAPVREDGVGRYHLVGFISHMGRNTGHGHYVCHIRMNDQWVIFDDQQVAQSQEPPFAYGYMYLYRRDDADASY